ncbi:MAG: hydrolase, partial [Caldilinea sp.]
MIIHHAIVLTCNQSNEIVVNGAVRYTDGVIDAVGDSQHILEQFPDDERWDANGMLLMPGQ